MRITILKILLLFICMSILLAGCSKAPDIKDGEETAKAKQSESSDGAKETFKVADDISEYVTETDDGYICNMSIGEGDDVFKLDAEVKINSNSANELKAKLNITDFDKEKLINAFFDDAENVDDISNQLIEEINSPLNEGQIKNEYSFDIDHILNLRKNDETSEVIIKDDSFNYNNNSLMKNKAELKREIETDISNDFTIDDAWNMLVEKYKQAELGDIEKQCIYTIYYEDGDSEYGIDYTQLVNGLPLVTSAGSASLNDLQTLVHGNAIVSKDGISEIQSEYTFWEITGEEDTEIIDIYKLMELLAKYAADGKIKCSDKIIYKRCELSYLPNTKDWQTANLTPVWRVYIPYAEYEKITEENQELWGKNITMSIVIDAVTGDIIRVD
ncbi:MAG: hypothetical protein IJ661_11610 [Lachnospiraceae bacterium]|nr:hypothetical protein [Lachnospiraceae bacterium]